MSYQSACPTTHSLLWSVCSPTNPFSVWLSAYSELHSKMLLLKLVLLLLAMLRMLKVRISCTHARSHAVSPPLLSVSYVVVSLWSPWSLQRRLMIFTRSFCEAPVILLSQLVRVSSPALCLSSAGLSGCRVVIRMTLRSSVLLASCPVDPVPWSLKT